MARSTRSPADGGRPDRRVSSRLPGYYRAEACRGEVPEASGGRTGRYCDRGQRWKDRPREYANGETLRIQTGGTARGTNREAPAGSISPQAHGTPPLLLRRTPRPADGCGNGTARH